MTFQAPVLAEEHIAHTAALSIPVALCPVCFFSCILYLRKIMPFLAFLYHIKSLLKNWFMSNLREILTVQYFSHGTNHLRLCRSSWYHDLQMFLSPTRSQQALPAAFCSWLCCYVNLCLATLCSFQKLKIVSVLKVLRARLL